MQIASYSFNMQEFVQRKLYARINRLLQDFPAVAILGPRQCGKTTLALEIARKTEPSIYVDLERPSDARKLRDPELYFRQYQDRLACLDEIHRQPDLFPLLRGVIDEHRRNGRFLILGSASRDLIRQSSETLAGRIAYLELTPFLLSEAAGHSPTDPSVAQTLWLRGGFPDSYLARDTAASLEWRENFIRTFLERDIPQLGFNIPAETLRRLWRMLAHSHGQQLNSSRLGEAIGVSHTTIRSYLDLLSQTFMIRLLQPQHANLKKRLVKSPKVSVLFQDCRRCRDRSDIDERKKADRRGMQSILGAGGGEGVLERTERPRDHGSLDHRSGQGILSDRKGSIRGESR